MLAIHNSAVCNCHKDDEFSPLLDLVDMGYMHVNKTRTTSDRISFGMKLRKALNQFTNRFVPHMKEEEEVFQPLLMKHFTEEELLEMKILVIKSHMQQRKSQNALHSEQFSTSSSNENLVDSFDKLPDEMLLKIFSFLNYTEIFKAATVSKKWHSLIYDKSKWKQINFDEWKTCDSDQSSLSNFYQKDLDYIDDSDEEFENNTEILIEEVKI